MNKEEERKKKISANQETEILPKNLTNENNLLINKKPHIAITDDIQEVKKQLNEGDKIAGRYYIKCVIGGGAFGKIYESYDEMLDRLVAIKVIFKDLLIYEKAEIKDVFLAEARTIAKLDHANIVPVYDAGVENNMPWIVMKLISGQNLEQILLKYGKLTLERTIALIIQALEALNYAHKKGIIHRDIKPSNLLIESKDDGSEHLWLADFGIAKILSNKTSVSEKIIAGTPHYMAPEQITGRRIDARADLFAIGCIFYEMVIGKRAFEGKSIAEIAYKIVHEHPPGINELNNIFDKNIVNFIRRSIAKSPQDRYQSAEEMISDLKKLQIKEKRIKIKFNIAQIFRSIKSFSWDEQHPLIIENLYKSYQFNKCILKGINLKINREAIYCLLGRNGSGKTTIIKIIIGILRPDKGIIRLFGRNPYKKNSEILCRIGYVPENLDAYEWMKIGDIICFLKKFYPNWDDTYCYHLLGRFGLPIDSKIQFLSKGMKTKLSLLFALSHKPEFLLLDDPTIGVDAVIVSEVFDILQEAHNQWGTTVFLASHNLEEVERIATHIGFIKDGTLIVNDKIANLKMKTREIKMTFRDEVPQINLEKFKPTKISGRRLSGIIFDTSSDALEKLKEFRPEEIEIRELSLKEIFVNFMK